MQAGLGELLGIPLPGGLTGNTERDGDSIPGMAVRTGDLDGLAELGCVASYGFAE
jgi:hypothetical protein